MQLRELVGAALIAQVHVWIRLVTEGRIGSGAHALAVGGIGAGRGRSRSRSRTLVWSARLVVVETHVAVLLCCPLFGQAICYAALAHDEEEDDAGAREDAATDVSGVSYLAELLRLGISWNIQGKDAYRHGGLEHVADGLLASAVFGMFIAVDHGGLLGRVVAADSW